MKTTIDIADALLEEARRVAAQRGMTLRSLVEAGIRKELDDSAQARKKRYELPDLSQDLGGLRPEFAGATFADILEESYRGRGT